MSETTKKRRIFHIAKELNISHLEIMSFLEEEGVAVSSHMAPVDAEVYDKILGEFAKERQQIERLRKEQARQAVVSDIKKQQKTDSEHESGLQDKVVTHLDPMSSLRERISNEKRTLSEAKKRVNEDAQRKAQEFLDTKKLAQIKADENIGAKNEEQPRRRLEKPPVNIGLKVVRRATDAEKDTLLKQKEDETRRKEDK